MNTQDQSDPRTLLRPLFLTAATALLATACVGGPPEPQAPDDEQLLELYTTSATYHYELDDIEQAQAQAVKALEIEPKNKAMRRMIGWVRLRKGSNEDLIIAERFFRDLTREGDKNNATTLGLATALERLGVAYDETSRAIAAGDRAAPTGRDAEKHAADLAETARDNWNEAKGILERSLEKGEGSTRSMNGLQRVHALLGNFDESLHWSETLLQRSEEELATWRRMLSAEDLTESEERLFRTNERAALDLCRNTHLFAATLLRRQGNFGDAVQHLNEVVATEPDLAQVYSQRAQLYLELGEYARAKDDLDRFIGLSDVPLEHPDLQRAFELIEECRSRMRG